MQPSVSLDSFGSFDGLSSSAPVEARAAPLGGRERVAIIGACEWGTALARVIGAATHGATRFEDTVRMWVPAERLDGQRLCDCINEARENGKYLPGVKLPINVVAEHSIRRAVSGATLLVFAVPPHHAVRLIPRMRRAYHANARALCLVTGVQMGADGTLLLASTVVSRALAGHAGAPALAVHPTASPGGLAPAVMPAVTPAVSVLVGADLLPDVVHGRPCELIIGCPDAPTAELWRTLLTTEAVHVVVAPSAAIAELVAHFAPIVALAAGFADGVGAGGNAKAAIVRHGLCEMRRAVGVLLRTPEPSPLAFSSALSLLVSECYGGHSAACAAEFARRARLGPDSGPRGARAPRWEEVGHELLGGARARGVRALRTTARCLRAAGVDERRFPLIARTYEVAFLRRPPEHIVATCAHDALWRARARRRMATAMLRGVGTLALACLVGVGVFLLQREAMSAALHVERLGDGAARTVAAASYGAAVCCVHSMLRWALFGIGQLRARSLAALAALLTAGLLAAAAAAERARAVHGVPALCGWLAVVPAALALGFAPLARAYVQQPLGEFLLEIG
ncbi:hypothetical protein KFE25_005194 [Diacronema lutheri]|uniref:Glycerol-3-phosphate dehydrogenase [NAD(+)] n=1 Tax=Diacronema lutheri TaxID=2081491 RepID=A0A8J6C0Z8_DIALT|nr:hypothetical protein KFE25_005194 [Diacronema lutheri]